MIREGATLVQSAADILEQVRPIHPSGVRAPPARFDGARCEDASDGDRRRVVALLGPVPVAVDEVLRQAEVSPAVLQTVLLELELAGRLTRHAGGRVGSA